MHSHFLHHLKYRVTLTISVVLLGATGAMASTASGPFSSTAACACAQDMVCHIVNGTGLYMNGNTTTCTGEKLSVKDSNYELEPAA